MKKHWTILMLPALLLTLAACGVEHPTLEDGTGVSVTLGEAVRLDTPDQLTVYPLTVDADQAKADIERAFGITLGTALSNGAYVGEDYSVTLDSQTGHWTYQTTKDPAPAVPPEEAISDQQAIDLATQFMTEKQLWRWTTTPRPSGKLLLSRARAAPTSSRPPPTGRAVSAEMCRTAPRSSLRRRPTMPTRREIVCTRSIFCGGTASTC